MSYRKNAELQELLATLQQEKNSNKFEKKRPDDKNAPNVQVKTPATGLENCTSVILSNIFYTCAVEGAQPPRSYQNPKLNVPLPKNERPE